MTTGIIALVIFGLIGIGLVFMVVRRAVRLAVRLTLVAVLLLALLVGALFVWWRTGGSSSSAPAGSSTQKNARPSPTRPARTR